MKSERFPDYSSILRIDPYADIDAGAFPGGDVAFAVNMCRNCFICTVV